MFKFSQAICEIHMWYHFQNNARNVDCTMLARTIKWIQYNQGKSSYKKSNKELSKV